METIKLMIAEDQIFMRNALAGTISDYSSHIKVIGLAGNGIELLEKIKEQIPDVILLDMYMPIMRGDEVLKILSKNYPSIRCIIHTGTYSDFLVAECALKGAAAYLHKNDANEVTIIDTINRVYKDGYYFTQKSAIEIIKALNSDKKIYYLLDNEKFSEREIEVIKLICLDKQIKEIADEMSLSIGTIKYHKANLFEKTKSFATVDLVLYAIRQGIFIADK